LFLWKIAEKSLVTSTQEQLPKLDEEPQMLSDVLMSLKNSVLLEQIRKRPTDNAILPNELFVVAC
jgi:hypothetical protein